MELGEAREARRAWREAWEAGRERQERPQSVTPLDTSREPTHGLRKPIEKSDFIEKKRNPRIEQQEI